MDFYIVFVDKDGRFELVTTVSGKNAEVRAKTYAKQIIAPDKQEVRAVSLEELCHNLTWIQKEIT